MAQRYSQIAIIDISSNEIRMYVAEKKPLSINFLERLKYPLNLGKDTFGAGAISFDKVNKLCDCLLGFIQVAKEYGIQYIKTVATTAVKEASNKDYILDQIYIKTGLNVKIIDISTEKLYIFKMLNYILKSSLENTNTLMAHIGSGSVGIAYSDGENTSLMQSVKMGALRISELFENINDNIYNSYLMIDEYLRTYTGDLKAFLPSNSQCLTITGNEAAIIAEVCGSSMQYTSELGKLYTTKRKDFLELYDEIKFKSLNLIATRHGLTPSQTVTFLPAVCIYRILLEFSDSEIITTPTVSLGEALVFEYFRFEEFNAINKRFNKNILEMAMGIAAKYQIPKSHYMQVLSYSNDIFDKMRKIHGMGKRDRLLLQLGAILHECGKFVNIANYHIHSYNLIKGSEISGLTADETEIIANIARYHSQILPSTEDINYKALKPSKKVLVSKLAAILSVADALDRSGKQKIPSITVELAGNTLILSTGVPLNTIALENWALKRQANLFREVFGMEILLKTLREDL